MSRMIQPLRFRGHSDDTFGEYGRTNDDYDNCANGKPIVWRVRRQGGPDAAPEGLYVWGWYSPPAAPKSTPGCWIIGIQQLDEGHELPRWPMEWVLESAMDYSLTLEIDAPADAVVELVRT